MSSAKETATKIKSISNELGWYLSIRNNSILEISKPIESKEDFVKADMEYYSILELLPSTGPGSIWGTDGGGVGAIAAMQSGVFSMKKSGGSKRVLSALAKLI